MFSHKKAQVSMLDLYIGVFIFIILITFILITWSNYNNRINEKALYEQMEIKALQVTDILIKSSGSPSNWENNHTTTRVVGLAESDRVISKRKVEEFIANITTTNISKMYNLENSNFYFKLIGDTQVYEKGAPPGGSIAVSLKRPVLFENKTKEVQVVLWR